MRDSRLGLTFCLVPARAGDRVITVRNEYLSNDLVFPQMKARVGIEIFEIDNGVGVSRQLQTDAAD